MNSSHSLITIGITAYNAVETLERALDSAWAQDWPHKEIIVVDDCSTDGTAALLQKWEGEGRPGLRIFRQPQNSGVAASRNKIIAEARGEFIAFFDDDDQSMPERLARQYERIVSYERDFASGAPVICYAARTQAYPDGTQHYEATMGMDEGARAPYGSAVAERTLTGRPFPGVFGSTATCSQMARTSVYRDLGGFDEAFRRSEDTDFNIRAALAGAHFAGLEEPLVTQTMTLASDKKLDEERRCMMQLLDKHRDFISGVSSYPFCRAWLAAKYDFLEGRRGLFLLKILKLFVTHPLLTAKRFIWALPNAGFNVRFSKFHNEKK